MKKKNACIYSVLIVFMLLSGLLVKPGLADESSYTNVSVHDAEQMIKHNPNLVILDVRNQSEYALGHLTNALLIPIWELENAIQAWNQGILNGTVVRPSVNDTVIVYCAGGSRSAVACQMLVEHGYNSVYNIEGGINAWMNAGYPISTTFNDVKFDVIDDETSVYIEPLLKNYCGCAQSGTPSCGSPQVNATKSIIGQTENQTIILMQQEYNQTQYQYNITKDLLWSNSDITSQLNRTVTFTSVTVAHNDRESQYFSLRSDTYNDNYNLSVTTLLVPLNSETYNASLTYISYIPVGAVQTETLERISSNSTIKLSQLYYSLSTVADKLGKEYGKSQDESLHIFEERYSNIADELKITSHLIEQNLTAYDRNILRSAAILVDDFWWCLICGIALDAAMGVGCVAVIACTAGLASELCALILELGIGELGAEYVCEEYFNCWGQGEPFHWFGDTYCYSQTAGQGYVYLPYNILGDAAAGDPTLLFAYSPGDSAEEVIMPNVQPDDYAHGETRLYGHSYGSYNSLIYIYVSPDNVNWYYITCKVIFASNFYDNWWSFNYCNTCFRYMAIIAAYSSTWGPSITYWSTVHTYP